MKQVDLWDMFKKASNIVCTWTAVVSPNSLSPTPSTSSAMKTPENAWEGPHDPEAHGRRYPNGILWLVVRATYRTGNKTTCKNLGQ